MIRADRVVDIERVAGVGGEGSGVDGEGAIFRAGHIRQRAAVASARHTSSAQPARQDHATKRFILSFSALVPLTTTVGSFISAWLPLRRIRLARLLAGRGLDIEYHGAVVAEDSRQRIVFDPAPRHHVGERRAGEEVVVLVGDRGRLPAPERRHLSAVLAPVAVMDPGGDSRRSKNAACFAEYARLVLMSPPTTDGSAWT